MDTLAAKIVSDLLSALRKPIVEYAIIPVEEQMYNKCPIVVTHNGSGHYLAIESWCLPHIYTYCDSKLIHSSKVTCGTSSGKSLSSELQDDLSKILVLLNPGYTTAWNRRRQLLVDGTLQPLDELNLSRLVLKYKPKSPESITYRQMIVDKFLMASMSPPQLSTALESELALTLEIASSYKSNYYAWSYRLWLFDKMISMSRCIEPLVDEEVSRMRTWIERNVSDSSGYHYLRQLRLKQVTHNRALITQITNDEMQFTEKLLQLYPAQKSLMYHRKFCNRLSQLFSPAS